jgi:hypothetical protein
MHCSCCVNVINEQLSLFVCFHSLQTCSIHPSSIMSDEPLQSDNTTTTPTTTTTATPEQWLIQRIEGLFDQCWSVYNECPNALLIVQKDKKTFITRSTQGDVDSVALNRTSKHVIQWISTVKDYQTTTSNVSRSSRVAASGGVKSGSALPYSASRQVYETRSDEYISKILDEIRSSYPAKHVAQIEHVLQAGLATHGPYMPTIVNIVQHCCKL